MIHYDNINKYRSLLLTVLLVGKYINKKRFSREKWIACRDGGAKHPFGVLGKDDSLVVSAFLGSRNIGEKIKTTSDNA